MEQSEQGGERMTEIYKNQVTIQRKGYIPKRKIWLKTTSPVAKNTCTNGDVDVTEEEYNKLQQVINAHAVSWVRMLNAGIGNNEQTRVKNNMIGTDSPIAPLYGLRKDHKPCQDDTEGPPLDLYVVRQQATATDYHT